MWIFIFNDLLATLILKPNLEIKAQDEITKKSSRLIARQNSRCTNLHY